MLLETKKAPPGTMPNGLQAAPEGLYVIDQCTEDIYLLDRDLKLVRTIPTPTENASGITIGDGYFWTGSNAPAQARYPRPTDRRASGILKLDMETGQEVDFFPTPDGGGIHGLEWVDGLLWITCFRPSALKLVDPRKNFKVLKTIQVPYPRLHGLAWDGEGLWCAHTGIKIIVKYNVYNGDIMDRIDYPEDGPAPHGLTLWENRLWSCDANWPSPVHPDGPTYTKIIR